MRSILSRLGGACASTAYPKRAATVAAVVLGLVAVGAIEPAGAKTPGHTYCFYGKCHRVKTLAETADLVGAEETIQASFYDSCKRDRYNPCGLTSSGERFDPDRPDNAASPVYPDGTKLLVWSPQTKTALVLRVNNAGPYWGKRKLDVSRSAAEKLGFLHGGVATVKVRVLSAPTLAEATYRKNRTYDPVPGYIGDYASFEDASTGMTRLAALEAPADAVVADATAAPIDVARGLRVAEAARTAADAPAAPVQVAEASEADIEAEAKAVERIAAKAEARKGKPRTAARSKKPTRVAKARTGSGKRIVVASRAPARPSKRPEPIWHDRSLSLVQFDEVSKPAKLAMAPAKPAGHGKVPGKWSGKSASARIRGKSAALGTAALRMAEVTPGTLGASSLSLSGTSGRIPAEAWRDGGDAPRLKTAPPATIHTVQLDAGRSVVSAF